MEDFKICFPGRIRTALHMLWDAGYEAYVVGGCVRDALLEKEPHDWDIATSAVPQKVKEIFKDYPQVDAGLKHGTVMVVMENKAVEITTFRIDGIYSDGRRPDSVCFTTDITEDLSRRDFTINACAATETELIDPFGGREDLEKRLIRCVGNPEQRFTEDALRILRGIRFSSELEFPIEKETKEAMFHCRNLLSNVSQERITVEFCKTLLGGGARNTLSEFQDILVLIVPEISDTIGFQQHNPHHSYDVFEHTLRALEAVDSDLILRTTMLFHDIAKPRCFTLDDKGIGHFYGHPGVSAEMARNILQRMRFPTSEIRAITELIANHDRKFDISKAGVLHVLNFLGEEQFRRLLKVKKADITAQNPEYLQKNLSTVQKIESILDELISENSCFSLDALAVNGDDLIRAGIPEGKQVGSLLHQLLGLVMDGKIENTNPVLLKKALSLYQSQ